MLLISLVNLNFFRNDYGFVASDDVLRAVSLMVQNAVRHLGNANSFIGHFSSTQLVVFAPPEIVAELGERIRSRVEQSLDYFYPLKDRDKTKDPKTRLALKMGSLLAEQGPFQSLEDLKEKLLNLS